MKPRHNHKHWKKACVLQKVNIRSYQIQTEDGTTYTRNRRHLNLSNEHFKLKSSTRKLKRTQETPIQTNKQTPSETNKQTPPQLPLQLRRSNRARFRPAYLKDYKC